MNITDRLQDLTSYERFINENTVLEPDHASNRKTINSPFVLLGFTNRCGSNLLGDYLQQVTGSSGFGEHLNKNSIAAMANQENINSIQDCLDYLRSQHKGPDGHFGVKTSWEQMTFLMRSKIQNTYSDIRVLHITRRDKFGQAVSLLVADHTKQWTSKQSTASSAAVEYNYSKLRNIYDRFVQADQLIQYISLSFELPYRQVYYEDLIQDPHRCMSHIANFLDIDDADLSIQPPKIKMQRDELNSELKARYISDSKQDILMGMDP